MGQFAGWRVPIFYSRIREEYFTCRERFGLFDISHLGKLFINGPDAASLLELTSCRVLAGSLPDRGRYTFFLNHRAGVIDGVMVFPENEGCWILTNAGAREKVFQWLHTQAGLQHMTTTIEDRTDQHFLFSLQGPDSAQVISEFFSCSLAELPRFSLVRITHSNREYRVSRMSYSREDGFEIMGDQENALALWTSWVEFVREKEGAICGFGVRDLLRFEAAYPLYGQEMDEMVSPLELGRTDLIEWDKSEFIGLKALLFERKQGSKKKLVGIDLDGKRIPRFGFPIKNADGIPCGHVTSGNYSFSLRKNLAMGLISRPHWEPGQRLTISVPRTRLEARIIPLPFTGLK